MKRSVVIVAAMTALAPTAFAADMPVKASPPVAVPFSWTGCYLGANGGGGWGKDSDWTDSVAVIHGGQKFSGWSAGGQVGCDYQTGPWVLGVAGMFDWSRLKGSAVDPDNTTYTAHTNVKSLDTATLRLGYAVDRSLLYVDGGAAWSRTERFFTPGAGLPPDTTTKSGWTVGVGWEQLISSNWSWKIEYNYADFGKVTTDPDPTNPYRVRQHINTVLVGLNYRFGDWGKSPVVAKY